MKEWSIQIPLVGSVLVEPLRADTEDEAISMAMAKAETFLGTSKFGTDKLVSIEELSIVSIVCEGNVCYAPLLSVEAELLDEFEDDDDDDDFPDEDEDDEDDEEDEEKENDDKETL
jgi:hypothetical protein